MKRQIDMDGKPYTEIKSGLYRVSYDVGATSWRFKAEPIVSLNTEQQWRSKDSKAHYAAVSGKFDSIEDASGCMSECITNGFYEAHFLVPTDKGDECSIFWCAKGFHKSQEAAESLASIMHQSKIDGLSVNWLIYGEGFYTFKNAAKLMKDAPITSAAEPAANVGDKANHQQIFFFNRCDGSSEKSLKTLCEQAGLTFAGINADHRDLRPWVILRNACLKIGHFALVSFTSGILILLLIENFF